MNKRKRKTNARICPIAPEGMVQSDGTFEIDGMVFSKEPAPPPKPKTKKNDRQG